MSKKLLSILLTVCMLLSMVPMSLFVSAEENALPEVAFTPWRLKLYLSVMQMSSSLT